MATVEDIRLLLRDDDEAVFTDESLEVYLATHPDSILRAAGTAIRALAVEYSQLGKSISTDDLSIDIRSRGKDLLAVADSFFKDALAQDAGPSEFIVVSLPARSSSYCVRPEGTPYPYRGVC